MHILIAEDDPASATLLAEFLKMEGHEVSIAPDGAEAWKQIEKAREPQLILLDWQMPAMDGMEVVRRIQSLQDTPPAYVIMLTSRGNKEDIIAALETGAHDYLAKPFDPGELRARIGVGCRMIQLQVALAGKIAELRQAIEQVKTLRGIVPICSNCKKIRDDEGYWNQVDAYISKHSEAQFTHGICPDCIKKLYPGLDIKDQE
jgi:DNA-binding response OmpR family regulator